MYHPPIMVITSNDERDFSDAFKRRCIVLDFDKHDADALTQIMNKHFTNKSPNEELMNKLLAEDELPTPDMFLQALFIAQDSSNSIDNILEILRAHQEE